MHEAITYNSLEARMKMERMDSYRVLPQLPSQVQSLDQAGGHSFL